MALKKQIIKQIRDNSMVTAAICGTLNRPYPTIRRWMKLNHEHLTMIKSLMVIADELKISHNNLTDLVD